MFSYLLPPLYVNVTHTRIHTRVNDDDVTPYDVTMLWSFGCCSLSGRSPTSRGCPFPVCSLVRSFAFFHRFFGDWGNAKPLPHSFQAVVVVVVVPIVFWFLLGGTVYILFAAAPRLQLPAVMIQTEQLVSYWSGFFDYCCIYLVLNPFLFDFWTLYIVASLVLSTALGGVVALFLLYFLCNLLSSSQANETCFSFYLTLLLLLLLFVRAFDRLLVALCLIPIVQRPVVIDNSLYFLSLSISWI